MITVKDLKTDMMVIVTDPTVPELLRQSPAKIISIVEEDGFYMVNFQFINSIIISSEQKADGFSILVHHAMVNERDFSDLFTIVKEDDPLYKLMSTPAPSMSVN